MVPIRLVGAFGPFLSAVADELGADLGTVWGDTGGREASGTESPGARVFVLADPEGDGERWIEPYPWMRLNPETWQPDPSADPFIPPGTFEEREVAGKRVMAAGEDRSGWTYFYASGPWFFIVGADTAELGEEVLEGLP
jgi:hypothetical protein